MHSRTGMSQRIGPPENRFGSGFKRSSTLQLEAVTPECHTRSKLSRPKPSKIKGLAVGVLISPFYHF